MCCVRTINSGGISLRCRFSGQEYGYIPAYRNYNAEVMIRALGLIIFAEFLAKAVDLYARYGVFTGIETRRAIQYVDGDIIFFDLIGFTGKILLTHVPQEVCETG